MNATYKNWIDLEVCNSYFDSDIFAPFRIIPFEDTAQTMKNYGLMVNKNVNLVSFYGKDIESSNFENMDNLFFQLLINDALFFNYTDIPFPQENQVFYFENGQNSSDPLWMHPQQYADKNCLVNLVGKLINVDLPNQKGSIEIRDEQGSTRISVQAQDTPNYPLNLNSLEDGRYQLWLDNQLQYSFFTTNQEIDDKCKVILKLNVQSLLSNIQAKSKLQLNFNSRSVYFQYQVVVGKNRKIEVRNMLISDGAGNDYEGPVEQEIIGKQQAQVFTSKQSHQLQSDLQYSPQLQVTYSNNFSDREKLLERSLPNPEVEGLKSYPTGVNPNGFLLSTIVYV